MDEHFIKIHKWLYPVSWIYGAVVVMRNKLFDWGIFRSKSFDVPVICVGNLAVGGTGKTPHTEYLIKLLHDKYQVPSSAGGTNDVLKAMCSPLPNVRQKQLEMNLTRCIQSSLPSHWLLTKNVATE